MIRYLYMEQNRPRYRIAKMAQWLQVSKNGYYAWRRRAPGARDAQNEALLKEILRIHEHSDRGSQYCSLDYQALAKEHGFISSMSRTGNCRDNAPMESFWGKPKQEWLNGQHFKSREEAKAAVFEYIWIFYNRRRIHEANGYLTPEEYYEQHKTAPQAA